MAELEYYGKGVPYCWNTAIAEILADDQGVRGVSLRDRQTGASQELAAAHWVKMKKAAEACPTPVK
jgi:hypothetical protein